MLPFASCEYLILLLSVSDELPSNIGAEVDCLKGMTPKTTAPSEEKTTDAAVQMEQRKGYVSLTLFLCLSFLKTGLIKWKKGSSSPKPKRVMPLESVLLLTIALAERSVENK